MMNFHVCALAAFVALAVTPASGEALLLIEANSGKVLQAENATMPWYPASTTKLMTAYVTLRAVRDGRLTLDTLLPVSPNAVAQQPSKMGFRAGLQVTVDNALKMLMVKSANDMAVVLAEGVSGSIEKFADEMNLASRRLGMTQSSWVNPNGLPADEQITSARDMAILARALIRELPEYDFYWHIPAIRLGKRVMRNYNTLIDRYPGADGMKTGFICASGFNLVASATRDGKRLIAVVLGAPSGPVRAAKAAAMLEQGFAGTGLSWLVPALGTVESLTPIAATPPNLREEMCGKHRKRPAVEEADDEVTPVAGDQSSPQAFFLSNLKGSVKPSSLIGPLVESQPPIPVFVGAAKAPGRTTVAATPASPGVNAARQAPAKKPVTAILAPAPKPTSTAAPKPGKPAAAAAAPKVAPTAAPKTAPKPDAAKPAAAKPAAKPAAANPAAAKPAAAKPAAPGNAAAAKPKSADVKPPAQATQ